VRAKLFVSPKLLLPPVLLAAVLAVLGTKAAANTHSVEPGDTLSRIAVNHRSPAASQETLRNERGVVICESNLELSRTVL
jgi:hypothetical protein